MDKINPASIEAKLMCNGCATHTIPKINELIDLVSRLQEELTELKGAGVKASAPKTAKAPAKKRTTRKTGGKPKSLSDV
jgi:hypothetical protein